MERFLPTVIIAESFFAGIFYALAGRFGESLYWFSAAVLNFAVVFLIPEGK